VTASPPAGITIRPAGTADLPALQEIEVAAGEQFRAVGMPEIAGDEPPSLGELAAFQAEGRILVAVEDSGHPVGYLLLDKLDRDAHVGQVSVHPEFARQGIGRALLEAAADWGRSQGLENLTLTTFAGVPWNAPYYRRLGFRDLTETELGPDLARVRDAEAAAGLARWPRVVLGRPLA
jgi:GNAT superfamily N-acetyltransferase